MANKVSELAKKSHGIIIPVQTIQRAVAEGTTGMYPSKRGNPSSIPYFNFRYIKIYLESYIKIKKINGKGSECDRKHLQATIKKCMDGYKIGPIKLATWFLNVNAIDLAAGRSSTAEQRIIMWNTYHNQYLV